MSFLDSASIAIDPIFRIRVRMALVKAATDIASSEQTEFIAYAKKQAYAVIVLNEPEIKLTAFCYAVASNPVITLESADGDIQFTVNSIIGLMAGVKPDDETTVGII